MSEAVLPHHHAAEHAPEHTAHFHRPRMDAKPNVASIVVFAVLLVLGLAFTAYGVSTDVAAVGGQPIAVGAFLLLGLALLIALGFEFVNGFHDTANAVATVIYTHSMPAQAAVIWSGGWNLLGVLVSTGGVAFTVVSLLPVELILQVGSTAGFAMIFALLIAAIIWNLGTWALGIPASSSHTLVGSIIGVGLANQFMAPAGNATSGVDWGQVKGVGTTLLVSPIFGFFLAAILVVVVKTIANAVVKKNKLFDTPDAKNPPPLAIRLLLILTCTLVSFFHGSNDGQKGMGLIMLILIGALPTAYALNRAMPDSQTPAFIATMHDAQGVFAKHAGSASVAPEAAKDRVTDAIKLRQFDETTYAASAILAGSIADQVQQNGAVRKIPAAAVQNVRNDMYLVDEMVRLMPKDGFSADEKAALAKFKAALDNGTKFIPWWVKVTVAIALGLGTMVGWKRIVVTVGEKIGKTHLTYGQGASAEIVAAATIGAADFLSLPVSTTHVLSSGIAGTMAANGSGLQWSTLRSIAMAWVLTLPAAMVLSGVLFYLFRSML
jgi:inorganic phosphate transporter, PiT family